MTANGFLKNNGQRRKYIQPPAGYAGGSWNPWSGSLHKQALHKLNFCLKHLKIMWQLLPLLLPLNDHNRLMHKHFEVKGLCIACSKIPMGGSGFVSLLDEELGANGINP